MEVFNRRQLIPKDVAYMMVEASFGSQVGQADCMLKPVQFMTLLECVSSNWLTCVLLFWCPHVRFAALGSTSTHAVQQSTQEEVATKHTLLRLYLT